MSNTVILHHSKAVIPRKITVLPCTIREEKSARIKECGIKTCELINANLDQFRTN